MNVEDVSWKESLKDVSGLVLVDGLRHACLACGEEFTDDVIDEKKGFRVFARYRVQHVDCEGVKVAAWHLRFVCPGCVVVLK